MAAFGEKTLYEIFSLAIEKEREAQELYRQAATLAPDGSPLKAMFVKLAEEERRHEQTLTEDYSRFKEGLSPKPV